MKDLAIDSRVFLDNDLDCALQEIDLLLNTTNTELIGDTSYGVELETFLWTLTPTTTELQKYITDKLNAYTYYCKKFAMDVECSFIEGTYRSIYLVEITLKSNGNIIGRKNYQYQ